MTEEESVKSEPDHVAALKDLERVERGISAWKKLYPDYVITVPPKSMLDQIAGGDTTEHAMDGMLDYIAQLKKKMLTKYGEMMWRSNDIESWLSMYDEPKDPPRG